MIAITASQLIAHAVGDYLFQSHWMATEKTKRSVAALAHVVAYTLAFLPLTRSPAALLAIAASHFVIDRWRLARFVVWAKNQIAPRAARFPWSSATGTGYPADAPPFLAVWLLIIADNLLHVGCNALALAYL